MHTLGSWVWSRSSCGFFFANIGNGKTSCRDAVSAVYLFLGTSRLSVSFGCMLRDYVATVLRTYS